MTSPEPIETRWFTEEVLPNRGALRSYLVGRFPDLPDVDNLVQESLVRVLRARRDGEVRSSKALLFAIAHNLACDAVRREKVLSFEPIGDLGESPELADETDVPEAVSKRQEIGLLAQAIQSLPAGCRRVFTLRTTYGMSQREIARHLGISENTVEKQVAKGIHRCTNYFARFGLP